MLAVRLYWGWQFMQTGWGKLTNIGKEIQFFTQLGIPAPTDGLNLKRAQTSNADVIDDEARQGRTFRSQSRASTPSRHIC
jgi:hypothetical protein